MNAPGLDLPADVLHVPHHGAEESNEYRFVREVSPDYAIISVGENNGYNHPDEKAMSVLIQATGNRENVMRTDELGTIACYTDGSAIVFGREAEERILSMLNNADK